MGFLNLQNKDIQSVNEQVLLPSAALPEKEKSSKSLKINRFSEIFLFPETYEKAKNGSFKQYKLTLIVTYSLSGKDVKVAIYDDMVEITSPGLLPPSIDYAAMESHQSDARNKVIAPVFKRMGIIDQWGNGLKLIADELKEYPQIDFRWKETGLSFQVQFVKLKHVTGQELGQDLRQEQRELQRELNTPTMYSEILDKVMEAPLSRKEISEAFGQKRVSGQLDKTLLKLIEDKLVEYTILGNKNHPKQKMIITKRGIVFLEMLKK